MFSCYCVAYGLWRSAAEAHHGAMQTKNQDLQITLARVTSLPALTCSAWPNNSDLRPPRAPGYASNQPAIPSKFGGLLGGDARY
jgi:hypothetical protein